MVNTILKAITKRLGNTFGAKYHYYVENVEQKLAIPCFTVDMLTPLQRSTSPILYKRTMPIVIHYFSDSKTNKKNDCYDMAEQIVECLEYLPFEGGLIRGEEISYQIVDDVLQIFVTYSFTTRKITKVEDNMENFSGNISHIQ